MDFLTNAFFFCNNLQHQWFFRLEYGLYLCIRIIKLVQLSLLKFSSTQYKCHRIQLFVGAINLINHLKKYPFYEIKMLQEQFLQKSFIKQSQMDNRGFVLHDGKQLKGNQCIRTKLGQYIDIEYDIASATLKVKSSQHQKFKYQKIQGKEVLKHVKFCHGVSCPLLNENIAKNQVRPMRPCSVVLIENSQIKQILSTKRPANLTFGGQWVLPGGHLEKNQSIFDGGLRECEQQVGLKPEFVKKVKIEQVMAWQSVFTSDNQIKATSIVIFFSIEASNFQVKPQAGEIDTWQWRSFNEQGYPWGQEWAQGHLAYLKFVDELRLSIKK